ncbi:MAG TPA: hypothetical protein VFQ61_06610 [Polyangiaceae bacterium]|nr:hypothetical protein [Polyangiaceae bacterium]
MLRRNVLAELPIAARKSVLLSSHLLVNSSSLRGMTVFALPACEACLPHVDGGADALLEACRRCPQCGPELQSVLAEGVSQEEIRFYADVARVYRKLVPTVIDENAQVAVHACLEMVTDLTERATGGSPAAVLGALIGMLRDVRARLVGEN